MLDWPVKFRRGPSVGHIRENIPATVQFFVSGMQKIIARRSSRPGLPALYRFPSPDRSYFPEEWRKTVLCLSAIELSKMLAIQARDIDEELSALGPVPSDT
jgi:hypothetical protein